MRRDSRPGPCPSYFWGLSLANWRFWLSCVLWPLRNVAMSKTQVRAVAIRTVGAALLSLPSVPSPLALSCVTP